ncbi:MAG: heme ABC transporter ATP-binding protein [Chloracidobacterium sp.]|nr:heme ABC transporter ATP-binding protein [Chloracidobacterium sp.]MDW8218114.1 heme ABC transporter ATP-binding protein [Acidobacteriota bacterium]
MMLEARRISVILGGRCLLDDVSLTLAPGEVTALLGPNGAGKSTLLKTLSGDLQPTQGGVYLDGRPLDGWSLIERARRRAVLPQTSSLAFPFTAFEVVLLGRAPHVVLHETPHDITVARQAMQQTGVEHLASQRYPSLSVGEQQRVQFARALAQIWEALPDGAARWLLLDEPTASLDLAHQYEAMAIARRLAQDGVGVIVVVHDLNLAAYAADHVVLLDRGRIAAEGRPEDVLTPERIQGVFGLEVSVTPHPRHGRPCIIPLPPPLPRMEGRTRLRPAGAQVLQFQSHSSIT